MTDTEEDRGVRGEFDDVKRLMGFKCGAMRRVVQVHERREPGKATQD